jgi:hypothetical protein
MKNYLKRFEEWSMNESSMDNNSMMNGESNMGTDLDDETIIEIFREALDYGLPYIIDDETGKTKLMYNQDEYSKAIGDIRAAGYTRFNDADVYIKILENGGTLGIGDYYVDVYSEYEVDRGYSGCSITMEDLLSSVRKMPAKLIMDMIEGNTDDKAYVYMLETVFSCSGK